MLKEGEDDENTNKDVASLIFRKRQKVNLSTELIHSLIDFGSGNEIIEPEATATPSELLTKHQTPTLIPYAP